ncbi:hypothetical protein HPB52_001832 [Rhipicephalus sanguineus]|uniref:Uncharacterized protein n=1 Tax=Rhipicephalus sanguineus TaxID=34632 RepID=A0A9D4SMY3_RHISA|nr:hypothetical protein HPB52_001832 [Rhipicephalus sanguineus]
MVVTRSSRKKVTVRTQERIKALAAASGEAPVKIVQQVTASVPASSNQHLQHLPKDEALRQIVRRKRKADCPHEPSAVQELIVEGEFRTTLDGRDFLRCDCTSPDGAQASDLLRWWEDNYLLGKSRHGVAGGNSTVIIRSPPIFPPSLWNVLALTQDGFPRGNNAVQALHRRWEILVGAKHVSVFRLITTMKREQARVEDDIEGAIRGQPRRSQSKKQRLRESRLAAALANWDNECCTTSREAKAIEDFNRHTRSKE